MWSALLAMELAQCIQYSARAQKIHFRSLLFRSAWMGGSQDMLRPCLLRLHRCAGAGRRTVARDACCVRGGLLRNQTAARSAHSALPHRDSLQRLRSERSDCIAIPWRGRGCVAMVLPNEMAMVATERQPESKGRLYRRNQGSDAGSWAGLSSQVGRQRERRGSFRTSSHHQGCRRAG